FLRNSVPSPRRTHSSSKPSASSKFHTLSGRRGGRSVPARPRESQSPSTSHGSDGGAIPLFSSLPTHPLEESRSTVLLRVPSRTDPATTLPRWSWLACEMEWEPL